MKYLLSILIAFLSISSVSQLNAADTTVEMSPTIAKKYIDSSITEIKI